MAAALEGTAVVIGAGQAGVTAAASLRENGWTGPIHLVGAESGAPYQRPPLSKGYLAGTETEEDLVLRATSLLNRDRICYHDSTTVRAIDRDRKLIDVGDNTLNYNVLILATGSTPRRLEVPGSDARGVLTLHSHGDAVELRHALAEARHVVIVGGGFLGLEIASFASLRSSVTVLERSDQVLRRAVSPPIAEVLADHHERHGVNIRYRVEVAALKTKDGAVTGVRLSTGDVIPADVVVVAIGATPNVSLAEKASLVVDGGIVVDERLRTKDLAIRAIGDCARHSNLHADMPTRLESVQNAVDQARFVAKDLTGVADGAGYCSVPWFWSHQGDRNLQIAGVARPTDAAHVVLQDESTGKMTVNRIRDGWIVAVETMNNPGAHIRARRLLAAGPVADPHLAEMGMRRVSTA
ncbi:NAD(P)/FAD-dependent oxidoreductase [Cryobacterium sp. Hh38]|uniref:NAD(P)/FAD-dependent oxidoreductase n=1 Tax=Cryobacterium sp. Hh38 TaxID=1259156 RepID=UPI00106C074B|nr:FAD-dependent oxidoreductase [Cryobacterium sp. Hh38]TFD60123.1 pyridine nucleotide-disulfide oxidoreductase [Cryobacterium sp. Hh38]